MISDSFLKGLLVTVSKMIYENHYIGLHERPIFFEHELMFMTDGIRLFEKINMGFFIVKNSKLFFEKEIKI